jgi:hypothetical protein
MALIGNLVARLRADHTTWRRDLRSAQRPLAGLQRSVVQFGAAVGVAFSTRAIINFSRESVRAFARQEDAVQALRAALAVTGKEGAADLARLTTRAAQLQQVTTKGDEAIISATASLALLATQLDAAELARAQEALIGIADGFTKGDVEGAALLVGKTIGSATNALTRFGIQVDTTASQSQKLAQIMAQSSRFFEVSQARALTFSGGVQQLGNAFGDLREALGGALAGSETVRQFLGQLKTLVEQVTTLLEGSAAQMREGFAILGEVAGKSFAGAFVRAVVTGLPNLMERILKDLPLPAQIATAPLRAQVEAFQLLGRIIEGPLAKLQAEIQAELGRFESLIASIRGAGAGLGAGLGAGGGPSAQQPARAIAGLTAGLRPRLATEGGLTTFGFLRQEQRRISGLRGQFQNVETVGPTLQDAAMRMNELASVTITGFGRMLEAASLGMDNMAVVVINSFNQIIQSLSRRGGPFGGFLGGLLGPIAGAAFGVIGALVSQRSQPQRVHVASLEPQAQRQMKDVNRVLVREILVFVRPGQSIAEAEAELARRRRRGVTPSRVG